METSFHKSLLQAFVLLGGFFLAVLLTLSASIEAAAATADDCLSTGGNWAGPTSDLGTCTYPPNTAEAAANCGANNQLERTYFQDESISEVCTPVTAAAPANPQPGYGGCGSEVRGPLPQATTISLCNGKNGAATFPIGACALKCTITSGLPAGAARKLPKNTAATLYVRTVDPGGLPNDDPYVVCFTVKDADLSPPTLYRFVGGSWVVAAVGNEQSRVLCASGSGDGAYSLGEPSKKD